MKMEFEWSLLFLEAQHEKIKKSYQKILADNKFLGEEKISLL